MNINARYCWILIFLFGTLTCKAQHAIIKADSLFLAGNFHQSGLYYERVIYDSKNPEDVSKALIGRVQSYKKLGLYDQAAEYIDQLSTIYLPDTVKAGLAYEAILSNFLSGNYPEVISRYFISGPSLRGSEYQSGANLIVCLSNLKSGRWDRVHSAAERYILELVPEGDTDSLINEFHNVFDTLQAPKVKKPRTARVLSMIIPGSGQVYAGYPGDGLTSFGLHVLALGGAGFAFMQGLYITGWIGGFGILQKLYFGGNHMAADLAEQKNRLNRESFIQPASIFLIRLSEKYN